MYIYDSRDPACKLPFGAVKAGEAVQFSIFLPKEFHCCEPVLKIYGIDDTQAFLAVPMEFFKATLTDNCYRCVFAASEPALYAYHFEFIRGGAVVNVKRDNGGAAVIGEGAPWQLTVYSAAMKAPSFLRGGVLYQIFPDRFANSGESKRDVPYDRTLRGDWGGLPVWRPNQKGEVTNSDYFCGDLKGIEQRLGYLKSLGVTAIYLNPVFEAHANHRYNTADYSRIDPLLGTNDDFKSLAAQAKALGISLILDGVFSHTGSDSVYFNKNRRYGEGGAYNDGQSPYREWYNFSHYPDKYESWWGFQTLPNVRETTPSYMEYICGEDGVLARWLNAGAAGFRLDVADELPDAFLDALHARAKAVKQDSVVIGEVWEDASNKISYGVRRRYLLGCQLDSVMNYPFMYAILNYVRWGAGDQLLGTVMQVLENYPKPAIEVLMNSLSTHDTERAITALAAPSLEQNGREWQERHHYPTAEEYKHGCELFKLASILQFGVPGVPCVYYGDEAGLTGYRDPFNRVCYPWGYENKDLVAFIAGLGKIRGEYPIFAEAEFVPVTFSRDICCFARVSGEIGVIFAVNRSAEKQNLSLPKGFAPDARPLLVGGEYEGGVLGPYSGAVIFAKCGVRKKRVRHLRGSAAATAPLPSTK